MITLTATLELDPLKKIIKDFVICAKDDLSDTIMHAAKEIVTLVVQYQGKSTPHYSIRGSDHDHPSRLPLSREFAFATQVLTWLFREAQ